MMGGHSSVMLSKIIMDCHLLYHSIPHILGGRGGGGGKEISYILCTFYIPLSSAKH